MVAVQSGRLDELDSLRGLAALIVVIHHCTLMLPDMPTILEISPLRLLWCGGSSVILFFLLSGFVLALPYRKGKSVEYVPYLIKRFFRIYVPYLISIILLLVVMHVTPVSNLDGLSEWFNGKWITEMDMPTLVSHLCLIGDYNASPYNPVIWSLSQEMRISIIFPIIMLLILRFKPSVNLLIAVGLTLINAISIWLHILPAKGWNSGAFDTFQYMAIFFVGALLAQCRTRLVTLIHRCSKRVRLGLLLAALTGMAYSAAAFQISEDYGFVVYNWGVAVSGGLIIILSLSSTQISYFLRHKVTLYLGKISYSVYLLHMIILLAIFHMLYGSLPIWSLFVISAAILLCLSTIFYRFVELPSIKAGRRLASIISSKRVKLRPLSHS